ncbi:hypothetical protein AVEN_206188-1 [Araneus ventricosus]|uniref:Fibronectin type-III domain-containing protein n=1 Tax=Araneus ventricosus TaxID=182803 RepID=A0A4Y2EBJ7_ARAVE|nr:hypothetical protein AVEN_206188-1 [Araneus ventricosus]
MRTEPAQCDGHHCLLPSKSSAIKDLIFSNPTSYLSDLRDAISRYMSAPESPHDCLVINQTLQSLTIECQPGYNGSLPQIFHMEIYNSIVEHMADNLTRLDKPRFHVTDLSPGTSYVLVIYASNIKGRSNSVALVASTLSTAERRTAQDDKLLFNPLIGVLIGVVSLFVIIGIVIVVIVFKSHISKGDTRKGI